MKGIDVSVYQPNIDWPTVAASGVAFCMIQLTQGTGIVNPIEHDQSVKAKSAGIKIGYYHFGHPHIDDARAEARCFIAQIRRMDIPTADIIPAVDVEWCYDANGRQLSVPAGTLEGWVNDFADEMAQAGFPQIIVYTNAFFVKQYLPANHSLSRFPLWQAAYQNTEPAPAPGWSSILIWQYNGKDTVPGIPEPCDTNVCTGDLPLLINS